MNEKQEIINELAFTLIESMANNMLDLKNKMIWLFVYITLVWVLHNHSKKTNE